MRLFLPNATNWLRCVLALLCPFACLVPANAQVAPARGTIYYLQLSNQPLSVPGRTVFVEQVVDGRKGQPAIGTIYHGLYDARATVMFRKGLEPELTDWFRQHLPQQPTDRAVVLCLRQLRVSEVPSVKNQAATATAELVADVYQHLPDGYHFVASVADQTSTRGIYSDAHHSTHVALLLQRCLLQLADANWALAARRPARTLTQLPVDAPPVARPAILRVAAPHRGVYYSIEQFLTNRPDTTATLELDTIHANSLATTLNFNLPHGKTSDWKGSILFRAKVRDATGERVSPKTVWGFSDGRQPYVRQQTYYRPLTRQGDGYTFVGSAPVDVEATNRRSKKFIEGSLGFGGYGGTGPDNTGQPMVYTLDMRTGLAAPLEARGPSSRRDTAFVYVYRPLGGPAEAQRLFLDDQEVGQLRPGQYMELVWPHFGRPMRLSFGTLGGPATLLAPNAALANYVKLLPAAALMPWQCMSVRQGEADVDALEKQRNP
ncbi:hypothetical protein [Hymenobacter arizonensis]|uniref:Uncharacterized protein n=1 Tax=Hymenobacter arizonensis TaxID=1227077 RepID=A0A1I5Z0G2_HYMAR|nr:hypothetical protein [Hymenobacter arizonensis]SFQ49984.1 hypothetical protein SAMN04515668_2589 [Hymenobacter arizonensis]